MASPILHIKDAYYFEVPKRFHEHPFASIEQVPAFLREAHPHTTLEEFNRELAGKILIPQPFGTLKNLYEMDSGFCISRFMIIELVAAILLAGIMIYVARKVRDGGVPRGKLTNFVEAILVFVRDQIARTAIGGGGHGHDHDYHEADSFVPLLWTLFFFILACNLSGLLPWAGSPTGSFAVTLALAAVTFATVLIAGSLKFGPIGFWLNQVPSMDLPWYAWPLKPMIWVIEVIGLLIRHGVLAVRLLANMVAGHLVILGIMGIAFSVEGAMKPTWYLAMPISVLGSVCFCVLELFVAFLQAYIFVFLSALFIGSAVHRH